MQHRLGLSRAHGLDQAQRPGLSFQQAPAPAAHPPGRVPINAQGCGSNPVSFLHGRHCLALQCSGKVGPGPQPSVFPAGDGVGRPPFIPGRKGPLPRPLWGPQLVAGRLAAACADGVEISLPRLPLLGAGVHGQAHTGARQEGGEAGECLRRAHVLTAACCWPALPKGPGLAPGSRPGGPAGSAGFARADAAP